MANARPTPAWAYASLTAGTLAWLAAAPLPFIDYGRLAGATAGVGMAAPFLLWLLSVLLGCIGVTCAVVAVAKTGGLRGGRALAWAGVAVSGSLLATYATIVGLIVVGAGTWRRWFA